MSPDGRFTDVGQPAATGSQGSAKRRLSCAAVVWSSLAVSAGSVAIGLILGLVFASPTDDSDPTVMIGAVFLLFGLPALAFGLAAVVALNFRWIRSEGVAEALGVTSLVFGILPVVGFACLEALFWFA